MELHCHGHGAMSVEHNGRELTFDRPIHGLWSHDGHLLVLLEEDDGARVLELYNPDTIELEHRIEEPDGWSFYILIAWNDEAAVVASSAEPINHRRDFHWLIDVDAGTIKKHAPFV